MLRQVVIAGAGQAGAQAAETLRRRGFDGRIVMVGDEPCEPYQRPPLSKAFLVGALERERLFLRPSQFYVDHGIELSLGRRVVSIDRDAGRVELDDGATLAYDALILATGGAPRPLPAPGARLDGVYSLRTLADTERIQREFRPGLRLVVVGGGYIGLEVAATARKLGLEVTVLEMADRLMSRVVAAPVSAFFEAEHAQHGVHVRCRARVRALAPAGPGSTRVGSVACDDGTVLPADLVLVAVGIAAGEELAAAARLPCANGILVDQHCRTADARIYGAGDCTNHPSLRYGRRVRLESVDNAFEQATSAALNLLGIATPHDKVPWFWSDQFDLKLVIVGLSEEHDQSVLRGEPDSRSFSLCYLRAGELVAIDTINRAKDQMAARKLIAARARMDAERLADGELPLKDCLTR
ncbi:MAG TPA: FAD-dependent oxidoreductase [Steroidobacteraceae bacterium]|nr:FAD-dependent oxidoreductase [Steroidobacteraceae bacterium]